MWQRFTEGTIKAIMRAQKAANDRSENLVKPEHLLIGLLAEDGTVAYRLLQEAGVVVGDLTRHLESILTPGPGRDGTALRLDTSAKKALDLALGEAQRQRHNYIGTEHLILGILAADSGATGITFRHFSLDLEKGRYLADSAETFFPPVPADVGSGVVSTARQREPDAFTTAMGSRETIPLTLLIPPVVLLLLMLLMLRGCG